MKLFKISFPKIILIAILLSGCSSIILDEKKLASHNLRAANEFLSENAKKEGIQQTSSGLQYKVVKAGTGRRANRNSTVFVHYRGRLLDSYLPFDASEPDAPPTQVPLGATIEGWIEGISLMREGGSYVFYIPPDLAYGERGSGTGNSVVGPNELLIYEIDLLKVSK